MQTSSPEGSAPISYRWARAEEINKDRPPPRSALESCSPSWLRLTARSLERRVISAETVKTDRTIRVKLEERFADTFILRDGQWKVVANYYVRADAKLPTIEGIHAGCRVDASP